MPDDTLAHQPLNPAFVGRVAAMEAVCVLIVEHLDLDGRLREQLLLLIDVLRERLDKLAVDPVDPAAETALLLAEIDTIKSILAGSGPLLDDPF